jgi:hypothetical protein
VGQSFGTQGLGVGVGVGFGVGLAVGAGVRLGVGGGCRYVPERDADGCWRTAVPGFAAGEVDVAFGLSCGSGD